MDKKYGLQLRVKPQQQRKPTSRPPLPKPALGFGGDDDEDDNVEREISRQSYKNKYLKDVEEQHKKALEEDPSAFDYDGVYDEMKQKVVRPVIDDRQERKPKYIQALIEKAKQREREHEIVYERKIAKERSKDDHLYAEKDKFVTSAYKKKLAEQAKWMEEERLRELREERDDVTKKADITDFYFNLSKNVAYGGREGDLRKADKPREELVSESPEAIASSSNELSESSKAIKRQESQGSRSPRKQPEETERKQSEETEAKPVPDPSEHEKSVHKPSVTEQPKGDHHKRNQDALSAAKERFLARKKAK